MLLCQPASLGDMHKEIEAVFGVLEQLYEL
jgi:hypothetical protein